MLVLMAVMTGLIAGIVAYGSVFKGASFGRRLVYAGVVAAATPVLLFLVLSALAAISFWVGSRR